MFRLISITPNLLMYFSAINSYTEAIFKWIKKLKSFLTLSFLRKSYLWYKIMKDVVHIALSPSKEKVPNLCLHVCQKCTPCIVKRTCEYTLIKCTCKLILSFPLVSNRVCVFIYLLHWDLLSNVHAILDPSSFCWDLSL